MNCYYQIGDGPWHKGSVTSCSGGREVCFCGQTDSGERHMLTLYNPEVLFYGRAIHITGYHVVDSDKG